MSICRSSPFLGPHAAYAHVEPRRSPLFRVKTQFSVSVCQRRVARPSSPQLYLLASLLQRLGAANADWDMQCRVVGGSLMYMRASLPIASLAALVILGFHARGEPPAAEKEIQQVEARIDQIE